MSYLIKTHKFSWKVGNYLPLCKEVTFKWELEGCKLTANHINYLFEIFGPFPVHGQYTLTAGVASVGKTRILIQDQDQLSDILFGYINALSEVQQIRVKELIEEWECLATKVVTFTDAERVRFRVNGPEDQRKIIKKRLQTFIPIFSSKDVEDEITGLPGGQGNIIRRG